MNKLLALVRSEAVLLSREPTVAAFVLLLPLALLLALGLAVDLADPASTTSRDSAAFVPSLAVALVLGTVGLISLPGTLALYREAGVLRRLSTTPASPAALLVAQLLVHLAAVLVGTTVLAVVALTVVGLPAPASPGTAVLVTALGALALFALGLLIAALSPSARASAVLGPVLLMPVLFLAGIWVPLEVLPHWLEVLGRHSPLGALVEGLLRAWAGAPVPASQLLAPAGTALVAGLAAVRAFRWE
ncbi:ABC transporter permease [Kineococcus indalonis]|uniref:ABC transporter permease n=1 Tax=Kineococcus indalonis TaxID=2696566 RepID=UPI001412B6C1|nr:ABC transporter permease [Kineococcus indalonis]NAZ87662.1 ABC transporter permease [Kineococcus indalonis]